MSHECPSCGIACHCGGDIGDMILNEKRYIVHCLHCDYPDDVDEDDDPVDTCDECGANIYRDEDDGSGLCDSCLGMRF